MNIKKHREPRVFHRLFVVLIIGTAMLASRPIPTPAQTNSADKSNDESVTLFDGKTLKGWTQRGGKAVYSVENGEIVGTTVPKTPNSFLCTDANFDNFVLELDFKVHTELNSGVQIRSNSLPDYRKGRVHGYQVEIDPSDRGWTAGIYDEARRGWLNDLHTNHQARYAFKQNKWNHLKIEAIGDRMRTWLNGVPAADLKDSMTKTGFIALQVHGVGNRTKKMQVRWKNIKLTRTTNPAPEIKTSSVRTGEPVFPVDAKIEKLAEGFRFTEGPAVGPDGRIYFNDIPNQTTHVFDPKTEKTTVFRKPSGRANGMFWTPNDALISCEGGSRRVTRIFDGKLKVLAEKFEGKKLNSPNDVVLDGLGGMFFTDPRYGNRDDMEMKVEGLYYINRGGKLFRVDDDLKRPNGLTLSPDRKTLYVADLGDKKIIAYDVTGPGKITNKRTFNAYVSSDGMTVDANGNIYCTYQGAVIALSPNGKEIGRLKPPEAPANCLLVGNRLYITARTGFYSVQIKAEGLQ